MPPVGAAAPFRYSADALVAFGDALLRKSGVRDDIARDVATVLVEGDLLGHTTHGLALLAAYLAEIEKGAMAKSGEPARRQRAARPRRPGTATACPDRGSRCARSTPRWRWPTTYGTGTVVIRRSHHIACLAAYLRRATDRGMMALIYCSDPSVHERGAVRRRVVGVHAQSVRRGHSDVAAIRSCSTFPRATRPTA